MSTKQRRAGKCVRKTMGTHNAVIAQDTTAALLDLQQRVYVAMSQARGAQALASSLDESDLENISQAVAGELEAIGNAIGNLTPIYREVQS